MGVIFKMQTLKNDIKIITQTAAVFIGTIVGAGLASGQEITQFFTVYGTKSFLGLALCLVIYIVLGTIIIKLSIKHNLHSYKELITLVSPGALGTTINIITSFFMISSAAIILAGSGALLNQYFRIPKLIGSILMIIFTLIVLLRNTEGLIEVNSIIVPCLITVITMIFVLYLIFSKDVSYINTLNSVKIEKSNWLFSSLLYSGFNILCCSGVLVPLSVENKNTTAKNLILGTALGAIFLIIISSMINFMLMLNIPYIFKYEIPLLYISSRFGKIIELILLCIIWCEMFSTEISDIYSIAKTIQHSSLKMNYTQSIIVIIIIALPISWLGFTNLISFLYPAFGLISLIFMVQCIYFYMKHK